MEKFKKQIKIYNILSIVLVIYLSLRLFLNKTMASVTFIDISNLLLILNYIVIAIIILVYKIKIIINCVKNKKDKVVKNYLISTLVLTLVYVTSIYLGYAQSFGQSKFEVYSFLKLGLYIYNTELIISSLQVLLNYVFLEKLD